MIAGSENTCWGAIRLFCLATVLAVPFLNDIARAGTELYFEAAGRYYGLNPKVLAAIAWVESRHRTEAINHNKNGSRDVCHMQINSTWSQRLGENWRHLTDPRYCTLVGAWILAGCVKRYGYTWDAVACYHTGSSSSEAPSDRQRRRAELYVTKVRQAIGEVVE